MGKQTVANRLPVFLLSSYPFVKVRHAAKNHETETDRQTKSVTDKREILFLPADGQWLREILQSRERQESFEPYGRESLEIHYKVRSSDLEIPFRDRIPPGCRQAGQIHGKNADCQSEKNKTIDAAFDAENRFRQTEISEKRHETTRQTTCRQTDAIQTIRCQTRYGILCRFKSLTLQSDDAETAALRQIPVGATGGSRQRADGRAFRFQNERSENAD